MPPQPPQPPPPQASTGTGEMLFAWRDWRFWRFRIGTMCGKAPKRLQYQVGASSGRQADGVREFEGEKKNW